MHAFPVPSLFAWRRNAIPLCSEVSSCLLGIVLAAMFGNVRSPSEGQCNVEMVFASESCSKATAAYI